MLNPQQYAANFNAGLWGESMKAYAWAFALGCSLAMASGVQAQGMDLSLTAATSNSSSVRKAGVIAGWMPPRPLWQGQRWRLNLRHELELAMWRVPRARNIVEFGYSPVFRLERPGSGKHSVFFVEGAIGARLLSHTRLAPDKTMSTAFQFSDMLGLGYQWGTRGQSTVGLRINHISNAGIKRPNPGVNFAQVYYRYRF